MTPAVTPFFHADSNTISYVVSDPATSAAAIIDAVLDFNVASGRTHTASADQIVEHVKAQGLEVHWVIETHAHADHLSAAPYVRDCVGGKIGIGEGIRDVQSHFREVFNLEPSFTANGEAFDQLFGDGDTFNIGNIPVNVMHTPGHTPSCMTYVVGDSAFVGDTLFMPDGGTARADFPGGDAATLYRSIQRILELDSDTRIFVCHDYGPGGREISWQTTVGEQRAKNIHVGTGKTENEFVELRSTRDAQLSLPSLIVPAIQINIRAGEMPPPEDNGVSYIKIPINQL